MDKPPARSSDDPAAPERKDAAATAQSPADGDAKDSPAKDAPAKDVPAKDAPATKDAEQETPADAAPRPATIDDVRTLRRWLLVTGVWAVAATAIAVIALVVANRFDEEEQTARTADQINRLERQLENRIDELDSRIAALPTSEDISDLDNRLGQVEDRVSNTSDELDGLSGRLDDIEQRVEELEQAETGGQTETETNPQ